MKRPALENLGRSNAISWWHQSCTAKMARGSMSVVDTNLKVYRIENLRISGSTDLLISIFSATLLAGARKRFPGQSM